jgi:hypothetical protein
MPSAGWRSHAALQVTAQLATTLTCSTRDSEAPHTLHFGAAAVELLLLPLAAAAAGASVCDGSDGTVLPGKTGRPPMRVQ